MADDTDEASQGVVVDVCLDPESLEWDDVEPKLFLDFFLPVSLSMVLTMAMRFELSNVMIVLLSLLVVGIGLWMEPNGSQAMWGLRVSVWVCGAMRERLLVGEKLW